MFGQINCHLQEVCTKELEVLSVSKYTIYGFTVRTFMHVTVQDYGRSNYELKTINTLNALSGS